MDRLASSKPISAESVAYARVGAAREGASRRTALVVGALAGVLGGWLYVVPGSLSPLRAEALAASPMVERHDVHRAPALAFSGSSDSQPRQRLSTAISPLGDAGLGANPSSASAGSGSAVDVETIGPRGPCRAGMVLVQGDYCTTVVHHCLEPYSDSSGRCGRYAQQALCQPPIIAMRFCIDEFEFPNRVGDKPRVMVNFAEAKQACEGEGKRLCTAREWTLACEGPERMPYPNGYVRDRVACNIDLPHRFPDIEALTNAKTAQRELDRLDQRAKSGTRPACVSPYGVYDLVGNVDEWVIPDGPEEAAGFGAATALKGGYFGAVRARCRPSTPTHGPTFKFYQVGFRCCTAAATPSQHG